MVFVNWRDRIPQVPHGNAFESLEHFYCKFGMSCRLETEEQYTRAKQMVVAYPGNYRILRYEGTGYVPVLYEISTDLPGSSQYVVKGEGTLPESPTRKSFEATLAHFRFVGPDETDQRRVWAWLHALDDTGLNHLWDAFDTPLDSNECIDEQFFTWPKGTNRHTIWNWFDEQFSDGLAKGVGMEGVTHEFSGE